MSKFVISPHFRLHEWVAEEKGYFRAEGLDYVFREVFETHATPNKVGAYTSFEKGRDTNVSCACHWTVNVAASQGLGKMYTDAYSVSPAGVFVPPQVSVPYFAEGNNYAYRTEHCNVRKQRTMADVYRRAGLANITIEAIDVRGLQASDPAPTLATIGVVDTSGGIDMRVEFLRGIAEQTGGRAVVRNNDAEREVRPLIEESSFYYLLGVEAPVADDGRLHAIKVNVTRPGVEVRTRRGYIAPTPAERTRMLSAAAPTAERPTFMITTGFFAARARSSADMKRRPSRIPST